TPAIAQPVPVPAAPFNQNSPTAATPVSIANGTIIQMPVKRPASRMSGLTLVINPCWTSNYGYFPIKVTLSSLKPTTADHVVRVQLHSNGMQRMNVEQDFQIPKGSTSVTGTIAFPLYQPDSSRYTTWDVWVDGFKDVDLSFDPNIPTLLGIGPNYSQTG